MELWIRTQRKDSLVKVDEIGVDISLDKFDNEVWLVVAKDTILARYRTKERTLEVLDEIENILKPKYLLDPSSIKPDGDIYEENGAIFLNYNANARIEELSTYVYQMPPEVE